MKKKPDTLTRFNWLLAAFTAVSYLLVTSPDHVFKTAIYVAVGAGFLSLVGLGLFVAFRSPQSDGEGIETKGEQREVVWINESREVDVQVAEQLMARQTSEDRELLEYRLNDAKLED